MPSYNELMNYLKQLCHEKADGTLFITTDQKHSVRFKLHNGHITSCNYRFKRDHDAIKLIKAVKSGKYKFFAGTTGSETGDTVRSTDLYTALFGKISQAPKEMNKKSGFLEKPDFSHESMSATASNLLDAENVEKAIEMIARELAHFIGPVARMICDEYINRTGETRSLDDLIAMADSVASEIGDSVQEQQFTKAVLGSIGSLL